MNYLPVVGWWFYGGTSATQTANYFASFGLRDSLSAMTIFAGSFVCNVFFKIFRGGFRR